MQLSNETQDYKDKRGYWFKSLQSLQAGNLLNAAADLAYNTEQYYIEDILARKFLLKLYMATGHLDYASKLSKRILQKESYR